jgi:hypothetical protein
MTPVSGNDEKHASEGERNARDDRSRSRQLEGCDLSGDEPDTGKRNQQEPTSASVTPCDGSTQAHATVVASSTLSCSSVVWLALKLVSPHQCLSRLDPGYGPVRQFMRPCPPRPALREFRRSAAGWP